MLVLQGDGGGGADREEDVIGEGSSVGNTDEYWLSRHGVETQGVEHTRVVDRPGNESKITAHRYAVRVGLRRVAPIDPIVSVDRQPQVCKVPGRCPNRRAMVPDAQVLLFALSLCDEHSELLDGLNAQPSSELSRVVEAFD